MKPVFFSAPERCVSRDDALVGRLVELWEASVRATHDFLSEEDIRGIRTYVPDALRSIADLRIVRDAEEVPVAFMGCDGRRLEMLFVDPACRGAGVGTVLVREAFAAGVTEVVVNEQNPSARGFYEHVGFAVCGRSERDEQGGPFPILYMKLNDNNKPNMEKAIAKDLLSIGAVFLRPEQPFTWASGIKSPIYCDNRLTLTAPEVRKHVEAGLAEIVRTKFPEAEVLMGTSTAGIAHAAITATILDLPMGYVRSGAKDHGRGNRIEGRLETGQKVVVIEDLISTAGSVHRGGRGAARSGRRGAGRGVDLHLRDAEGARPVGGGRSRRTYSLSNLDVLAEVAAEEGYIRPRGQGAPDRLPQQSVGRKLDQPHNTVCRQKGV